MGDKNIEIGIKNYFKIYHIFINAAFVIFLVLSVIFWVFCCSDHNDNELLKNGIEVEAEIVDIQEIDITPSESSITRAWVCVYSYVSSDGKEYSGTVGEFSQKKFAAEHLGEKVTIVINPTNGYSVYGTLSSIARYHKNSDTHLLLAGIFTGLFCIAAYLFFYRVVYRQRSDRKISEKINGRFVNDCIAQGEVTKVRKWIVCYVKVKYQDDNGAAREKWARSWFTHKEAKFLQQKKIIDVVPYKNTYGILEEMPITKK